MVSNIKVNYLFATLNCRVTHKDTKKKSLPFVVQKGVIKYACFNVGETKKNEYVYNGTHKLEPKQKPLALYSYLIDTFTTGILKFQVLHFR